MHDDREHVERRLERTLRQRIRPAVHPLRQPLGLQAWHVPGEPVPVADALAATYEPFEAGDAWGTPWSTTWFRLDGTVPADWAGRRVEVVVDLSFDGAGPGFQAEGLVHDGAGHVIKGIHPRNDAVPVANPAAGGERVEWLLEAAANPVIHDVNQLPGVWTSDEPPRSMGDVRTAPPQVLYRLRRADLAVLDEQTWGLALDFEVLQSLMHTLPVGEPRRHELLRALERAADVVDAAGSAGVGTVAEQARAELADVLSKPANASAHRLTASGHAHIDSAWLWPIRETKRKCARTFSNVVALAQDYPELVFACSSAQQYAWVREQHPEVFERMQAAAKAGNWAPVGGMWVESDANMPSGEGLVRQLVHGTRFFLEHFGTRTREVWLPDSFGYTAAFPQLARLSGAQFFLTQKLSWNATNVLPHHTFWWEGLDGTKVFTHFPPVDTYNSDLTGGDLAHAVENYAEKGAGTRSLVPFGYGDGGGGPTREMLERARRVADLEGSPRVEVAAPSAFFEAALAEYPDAPVWSGELYLELHRGTYTSQHLSKAGNRRSERLLREAELWCTTAAVHAGDGYAYPYDDLDRLWRVVLLHQFHDILPGSSIGWVHREAAATHAQVAAELEGLVATAAAALAGAGSEPLLLNASTGPRTEVVEVDGRAVTATVPASGPARVPAGDGDALAPVRVERDGGAVVLDNGVLSVRVDEQGLVRSVVDHATGREAVAPGAAANLLQLHPDRPVHWDAWDIDPQYSHSRIDLTEVPAGERVEVEEAATGVTVRVPRTVGATSLVQTMRLRPGSGRLECEVDVDWQEDERVLKVTFPVDVHTEEFLSEVQFGHVRRSTKTNTSWELARFETCAHRWVHVSEPGYGVAVLNEATYGHDVRRTERKGGGTTTTVRLTLLRAPRHPDPSTDRGRHVLRYDLLPGAGVLDAVHAASAMVNPLRPATGPAVAPLVGSDDPGVVVDTVKLADDRSGDLVVRLYEAAGTRGRATLSFGLPVTDVSVVDLLEDPLEDPDLVPELAVDGGAARVGLRPFQVVTLRARRA